MITIFHIKRHHLPRVNVGFLDDKSHASSTLPNSGRKHDISDNNSLGGYESRWKIEFGFEYFTGNHERRHLEEGISISFACTVYMY